MARAPKRSKPKTRHYRCARCRSLIPVGYSRCVSCGHGSTPADELFGKALAMFPGSREIK